MEILLARLETEVEEACARFSTRQMLGCDIETSHLSTKVGKIWCIQVSDGAFSAVFPFSENLEPLRKIFADQRIMKIFHNAKFDISFLRKAGFNVANFYCTMTAEKLITKGADQSVSLSETVYRYFGISIDKSQRDVFTKGWDGTWTQELIEYVVKDVIYLPQLAAEQAIWLRRLGLEKAFEAEMQKLC